jgi:phosphoglycolate/pyridoxal phosphate phosphatase family enzyme
MLFTFNPRLLIKIKNYKNVLFLMELNELNKFDSLINKYDYYIFDCDGVIWRGSEIINSAVLTINKLIQMKKNLIFLSNTNTLSRQDLYNKLIKAGISSEGIAYRSVYTSSYLIAKHITVNYPTIKKVYLIGMEGLRKELEGNGLTVMGGLEDDGKSFDYDQPDKYVIDDNLQAVVCGYDKNFNYYKMFYAGQVIIKTGMFFGTNYDHKINIKGVYLPASYTIISSLEKFTEQMAEIITKPDPRSLSIIMKDHDIDISEREKFIMIGDNLGTDILFANNAGIASLLVFTGITTKEDYIKMNNSDNLLANPTCTLSNF